MCLSLFTFPPNFANISYMSRKFRAPALVCLFIVILFFTQHLLRYLLIDDTKSYTRLMMHEMYNSPQNIDALFVGSSHCYRALDPDVTDGLMGVYTFNAGTSSQYIDGAYALIKEVQTHHDLKTVYVESEFNTACAEPFKDRSSLLSTYIISEYMPFSLNKLSFLLNASSIELYPNSFLPLGKYKNMIDSPAKISAVLEGKNTDDYRNFAYVSNENESYMGRGYVATTGVIGEEEKGHREFYNINLRAVSEDWKKTVRKIGKFCADNGIELVFFCSPMNERYLDGVGNYDEYVSMLKDTAAEVGASYHDFNLCRDEYLDLDDGDFLDLGHLNREGAEKFSRVFGSFYGGNIDEDRLFFDSYEEKKASEEGAK